MKPPDLRPEVQRYAEALSRTGMPEREVARAVLYARHFGLQALEGPGHVTFSEPSCGNWNCLNPDHQVLDQGVASGGS